MILIDDREDENIMRELSRFGIVQDTTRLDFGDAMFESKNGHLIGFERKRLTDLIASMQDRRLAGYQLSGMRRLYDRLNLIIEGLWRPSSSGAIEVFSSMRGGWSPLFFRGSGISFRQVDSYLETLTESGVRVWRTGSSAETVQLYASRYRWWQKDYELHRAHEAIYTNDPKAQRRGVVVLHQGEPNLVTTMAAQIPGIDAKAWDIGKFFDTPYEMCAADVAVWRRVPWIDRKAKIKHFEKGTAESIVIALKGKL